MRRFRPGRRRQLRGKGPRLLLRLLLGAVTAIVVLACTSARATAEVVGPARVEDGWNVGLPPLPDAIREGSMVRLRLRISSRGTAAPDRATWFGPRQLRAELIVDGQPIPFVRDGDDFRLDWRAPAAGAVNVRVALRWSGGAGAPDGRAEGPARQVQILRDTRVRLPETLDFGTTASGCDADAHCRPLDLSASERLEPGIELAVRRVALTAPDGNPLGWPDLGVSWRGPNGLLTPLERGGPSVRFAYDPGAPPVLCYSPPRCTAVPVDPAEVIHVAPTAEELSDPERGAFTVLVARVSPNTWIACNLWWILALVGLALFAFVGYGITSPHAFSASAMLFVGNKESALARDPGRPLRAVPNGRRGFYRSASCAFDATGVTVSGGGAIRLEALAGGHIRLVNRGVDVQFRDRHRWKELVDAGSDLLMPGVAYRVNGAFFFRVDT